MESYYKQALDIYERTMGVDDSNVGKTKNNLVRSLLLELWYYGLARDSKLTAYYGV